MLEVRSNNDRGHANHGWLDTHYTFSFSDYYDPDHMGFRALRVINEDTIAPGGAFGAHSHANMEILSYVLSGELAHKDSLGSGDILKHGEIQFMSAGTGIRHSESNPSAEIATHLLQIWLLPNEQGLEPRYEQKLFPVVMRPNQLHLIASRDGREGSFLIHSDAEMYAGKLERGIEFRQKLTAAYAWIQIASGEVAVNGQAFRAGDGIAISDEDAVRIGVIFDAEILIFHLG